MISQFNDLLRAAHGPESLLVDEAQGDDAVGAELPVLVIHGLLDQHLRKGHLVHFGHGREDIPHPERKMVVALHGDDGNLHAQLALALLDGKAHLHQHRIARALKVTDIVGVMDDAHLIGLVVPHREGCLEGGHN